MKGEGKSVQVACCIERCVARSQVEGKGEKKKENARLPVRVLEMVLLARLLLKPLNDGEDRRVVDVLRIL